ncbi:MAG: DUF2892 domain-containing protein [bacterium]
MKKNEGKLDRIIRVIAGIILLLPLGFVRAPLTFILALIAIVLLFTAATGVCGIYTVLGINTCKPCESSDNESPED